MNIQDIVKILEVVAYLLALNLLFTFYLMSKVSFWTDSVRWIIQSQNLQNKKLFRSEALKDIEKVME